MRNPNSALYMVSLLAIGSLTGCLDLPIEGEVSGHSMSWITTSLAVGEQVVDTQTMEDLPGVGLASQVLLADFSATCDGVSVLASPEEGLHTLALSIQREEDGAVIPGEYWIGEEVVDGAVGRLEASFLTGLAQDIDQENGTAGVLVVSYAEEGAVEGEIHIDFPGGTLRGYFSSLGCQ